MKVIVWLLAGLCCAAVAQSPGPSTLGPDLRELIYQGEVFDRRAESLAVLRDLLAAAEPTERRAIVRAMAALKHPDTKPVKVALSGDWLRDLERPRALIRHRGQMLVLSATAGWLELGDWLNDYFLVDIQPPRLLLETWDGFPKEVILKRLDLPEERPDDWGMLRGAKAGEVLSLISKKAGLNSFIPSEINRQISGFFPAPDWLTFLDRVCEQAEVSWTRRRDSVVFSLEHSAVAKNSGIIRSMDRKNENLARFLIDLAQTFGMELLLDERLAEVNVDIHTQDQPWHETLDCLAIMNGFNWDLLHQPGEKPKLVIQGEWGANAPR